MQEKISQQTLEKHLKDLKLCFIRIFIFFTTLFVVCLLLSNKIFTYIIKFLQNKNLKLIFSSIESGFLTEISIAINTAFILSLPIFALEIIIFAKDAIAKERIKQIMILYFISILLYFMAIIFTINFILPIFIEFLTSFAFTGVDFYLNTALFIKFIFTTLTVFSVIFQVPILLFLLVKLNILKLEFLKKKRKFIFVICFILGALLTPPDVVSQIVCALMLYLFFEISLFLCRFLQKTN